MLASSSCASVMEVPQEAIGKFFLFVAPSCLINLSRAIMYKLIDSSGANCIARLAFLLAVSTLVFPY